MIDRPFEIGCPVCDHTDTWPPTLDGIRNAAASYAAHVIVEHWEDLAAKREEALREDVH
jgi:hypothetical protein